MAGAYSHLPAFAEPPPNRFDVSQIRDDLRDVPFNKLPWEVREIVKNKVFEEVMSRRCNRQLQTWVDCLNNRTRWFARLRCRQEAIDVHRCQNDIQEPLTELMKQQYLLGQLWLSRQELERDRADLIEYTANKRFRNRRQAELKAAAVGGSDAPAAEPPVPPPAAQ